MKYTFIREGKEETVQPERWAWGVVYKDGTELKQFDNGIFHQFQEIKQDEVEMFVMFEMEGEKRIDMVVTGKQIFHFYRNFVFDYMSKDKRQAKVYVFGWKNKESGDTSYHYILPDDRIVVSDQDVDLNKFNI